MDVRVGFAEFDALAPQVNVQVAWAEFDTRAVTASVVVSWAEFDVRSQLAQARPAQRPPVYNPGMNLAQFFNDSQNKYTIPVNFDPEEEEEAVAAILIEIATYVL